MIGKSHRDWYLKQLRTLATATHWLSRPDDLALRIHTHIAKREGDLVRAIIANRFETEGGSGGGRWKQLALRTAIQRRKQGWGEWNPILRRSCLLMRAAVGGRLDPFPDRIECVFKDGPSPVYKGPDANGKGTFRKARRQRFVKLVNTARGGEDWRRTNKKTFDLFRGERAMSGMLGDYADELNQVRPFYGQPTPEEVEPVRARGRELLQETIRRIAGGEPIGI
jgi:hypothetical protein